jgi:hypothetical protein
MNLNMTTYRLFVCLPLSSERQLICSVAIGAPDMDRLRRQFRSTESTKCGPYFRGYCGEHTSEHGETVQLAGAESNLICYQVLLFINLASDFFQNDFDARARNRDRLVEEAQYVRASITCSRPASAAHTRIRGRRNAIAPSHVTQTHNLGGPLIQEQGIIDRLQAGEGVLGGEMADLFEKCTSCDHYFVASLLRLHIVACAPDLH